MTRRLARTWLSVLTLCGAWSAACGDDSKSPPNNTAMNPAQAADGGSDSGAVVVTGLDGGAAAADAGAGAAPQVTVENGQLEGKVEDGINQFLGIPYAQPPVGALRWLRPKPAANWSGVRAATDFGKRCAQNESQVLMNAASMDEDCLYLNVWTPNLKPSTPLPVMFWIHGGGNQNGSANEPVPYANSGLFYTGQFFAKNQGVIVVSLNYRLGAFGFFSHPAIDAEQGAPSGNQGVWDQNLALQWVQKNIAQFGGDPKNVTIFGESAGSFNVCWHVASPKSTGLFARAISESGGCTTKTTTKAEADTTNQDLASQLGCSGDGALACLRGKSVADILSQSAMGVTGTMLRFGPVVDGDMMPDQPRARYDRGDVAKVPYLLGSNTDEGTLFTQGQTVTDEAGLRAAISSSLPGADVDKILAVYPLSKFADQDNPAQAALARILGDAQLVCSTWDTASRMQKLGVDVYMYNFDVPVVISSLPTLKLGATHGSELVYVFQTSPAFTPADTMLSNIMQTYWATFAKTGDPNDGKQLQWPKFTPDDSSRINFALMPSIVPGFRKTECMFWQAGYDLQFNAP